MAVRFGAGYLLDGAASAAALDVSHHHVHTEVIAHLVGDDAARGVEPAARREAHEPLDVASRKFRLVVAAGRAECRHQQRALPPAV